MFCINVRFILMSSLQTIYAFIYYCAFLLWRFYILFLWLSKIINWLQKQDCIEHTSSRHKWILYTYIMTIYTFLRYLTSSVIVLYVNFFLSHTTKHAHKWLIVNVFYLQQKVKITDEIAKSENSLVML